MSVGADGQETNLTMIPMHDTNATAARSGMITMSGLRSSGKKVALANKSGRHQHDRDDERRQRDPHPSVERQHHGRHDYRPRQVSTW